MLHDLPLRLHFRLFSSPSNQADRAREYWNQISCQLVQEVRKREPWWLRTMAPDDVALTEESAGGVSSSISLGGTTADAAPDASGGGGSRASAGGGSCTEPVVSDLSDSSGDEDVLRKVIHTRPFRYHLLPCVFTTTTTNQSKEPERAKQI